VEKGNLHLTIGYVLFFDLATRASGITPAEWSLKVAEFDHRHRGIFIPFEMNRLADQVIHQLIGRGELGDGNIRDGDSWLGDDVFPFSIRGRPK
jgi:hypothetical protein